MSQPQQQSYENYGLADCRTASEYESGIAHPYYAYNQPNAPSGAECDNRSYAAYSTDGPYKGYYHAQCIEDDVNPACDLMYLNAPPQVSAACWKTSRTQEEHVQCVAKEVAKCASSKPTSSK